MTAPLPATMGRVVKRITSDWPVVTAALITVFLATMLLAAGPIYADAVSASALRATIEDAPVTESNLVAQTSLFPEGLEDVDGAVQDVLERAFRVPGAEMLLRLEGDTFGLPGQDDGDGTDLVSLQHLEGIEHRAELVTGVWPTPGSTSLEVAVNRPAAHALGIEVGDRLDIIYRRDETITRTLDVVGIYEATDPADRFWLDVPLARTGMVQASSFRTLGPFVTSSESIRDDLAGRVTAAWRVFPRYEDLRVDQVNQLRAAVAGLKSELDNAVATVTGDDPTGVSSFTVTSEVSRLLAGVDHSLTVTRSSVVALMLQLAILAGYALVLTAGLIADARMTETTLLRSRGTSPRQVGTLAAVEGLILTVPCVLLAPLATVFALRMLNLIGPLSAVGLTIDPRPTPEAFLLVGLGAIMAIGALSWPAWRSAREFGTSSRRGRQSRVGAVQRFGIDLALITLAGLAIWQLTQVGPELGARVRGRLGVDPVLVVAPVLGLLAGSILALRIVPTLARAAEGFATARQSTIPALASWQLARRPLRYARSSLLLIIAVGIGCFAASYATTWTASQRQRAAHLVGADVSVVPDQSTGSIPDLLLPTAHETIDTVEVSTPVWQSAGDIGERSTVTRFVAIDAAKAAAIADTDLGPEFEEGVRQLLSARPTMATAPLPGEPDTIELVFSAVEHLPPEVTEPAFRNRVRLIVQDGTGLLHRLEAGSITADGETQRLLVPLTHDAAGVTLAPAYPLGLVAIEIESIVPADQSRTVDLVFGGIRVHEGETALDVEAGSDPAAWDTEATLVQGVTLPSITTLTGSDAGLEFTIETGSTGFMVVPSYFSLRPAGGALPATYPVLVSQGLIDSGLFDVGQIAGLPPLRVFSTPGLVVGTIERFPTIDPRSEETVLVDLPTLQMMAYEPGLWRDLTDQYWLGTTGADDDAVVAALQDAPFASFTVTSRQTTEDSLVFDPIALGAIGALVIGFVAAALFAAVGFGVSAVVSARERLVEFSLLRALGLSPGQLGRWLLAEQGVLVVVSLVLGTILGLVLTRVLIPLVSLTQDGSRPVPEITVEFPWRVVLGMQLSLLVFLLIVVTVLTVILRRVGLGRMIRMGEDR
jgi:hypothetical protein